MPFFLFIVSISLCTRISAITIIRRRRPGWGCGRRFIHYNRYDSVTVMFSGIVGFAKYCAENSDAEGAMKIVTMLNELYTSFDALTDPNRNPNIYKVRIAKLMCLNEDWVHY